MSGTLRIAMVAVFAALWLLSLFLPVTMEPVDGLAILIWGWMGVLGLQFAWFANLLLPIALLMLALDARSRWAGGLIAIPLFLLGAEALIPGMTPGDYQGGRINPQGAPPEARINGPGYYLWVLVMIGAAAALFANTFAARTTAVPPAPVIP